MTVRVIWMVLLFLRFTGPAVGQTVHIQASVDRTRVAVDDPFSFNVVIELERVLGSPDIDLGLPDEVEVIRQSSSTSTSIQVVGGAMTQTRTLTRSHTLRVGESGTFVLGPVRLSHEGRVFQSNPVRVEAVQGLARPRTSTRQGGAQPNARQLQEIEKNLFIRATADRPAVFVGEQVLVSYDLYSRFQLQNVRYGHLPSFTGFWAETVFDASRLEQRRAVVDGQAYNRSSLKKVALFPTTEGTHDLEQLEVQCDIPVRSRRRSLFDVDDFMGFDPFKTQQVTVRSEDLAIVVKPLPKAAPASFTGAVGRYVLEASAKPVEVRRGDPVTLTVKVNGRGNLHSAGAPVLDLNDHFKVYDPKTTLETRFDGRAVTGYKTFEFVVIPSVEGDLDLPPVEMAYFDPSSAAYEIARAEVISLRVLSALQPEAITAMASSESVRLLGEDIRHIKGDADRLVDQGSMFHESWWFLILQGVPVVGFLLAFAWQRHQRRLTGDVAYARRRRSRGHARKRLAEAERLMGVGDTGAFHSEINRALSAFLADRLNLQERGLTPDQAESALRERAADPEATATAVSILRACDLARFASVAGTETDMRDLLDRTRTTIDTLERLR